MDIEKFREYCLSLGEVTEKTPFGKFLCGAKRQRRLAARFDSVLVFFTKLSKPNTPDINDTD